MSSILAMVSLIHRYQSFMVGELGSHELPFSFYVNNFVENLNKLNLVVQYFLCRLALLMIINNHKTKTK